MSNRPLIQACVLLMGELSPLDREAVTATFASHVPVPYVDYLPAHNAAAEEFLPIGAGLAVNTVAAERVAEILAELNGRFVSGEGWWDWIDGLPESDNEAAADALPGEYHLVDGTVLVWEPADHAWVVLS